MRSTVGEFVLDDAVDSVASELGKVIATTRVATSSGYLTLRLSTIALRLWSIEGVLSLSQQQVVSPKKTR